MLKLRYEKDLELIAEKVLNIPTLDTQNSDELDFYEISVWSLKEALKKAYEEGLMRGYREMHNKK
jgi:phosphopantetheinyl transferase (holo-ACP synthase)